HHAVLDPPDDHLHQRPLPLAPTHVAPAVVDHLIVADGFDPHDLEPLPHQHLAGHRDRAVRRDDELLLVPAPLRAERSGCEQRECGHCDPNLHCTLRPTVRRFILESYSQSYSDACCSYTRRSCSSWHRGRTSPRGTPSCT